ncbi:MAG TPA: hypothetical protein VGN07_03930 [Steroidobacteraceae bacterium]|jgi:hypothetical protein
MRVAILVLGILIGVLTIAASSIDVNAAVPAGGARAAAAAADDAAANHHRIAGSQGTVAHAAAQPSGAVPVIVTSDDAALRLASLDPSQFVYEYVQDPPTSAPVLLSGIAAADGRVFPVRELRVMQHQRPRTAGDFILMGCAALMLVAYQLRRKHRFLRPHPFGL